MKLPPDLPSTPAAAYRRGFRDGKRHVAAHASAGGTARAASLTPERRREIAAKAIAARWAKRDEKH